MPVVSYGCGTWSPTLRAENRLRVFENGAMWETFGSKRDGSDRRIPRNVQLNDLYRSSNVIRVIKLRNMRWGGGWARIDEKGNNHRVLIGKRDGKRPLGRPRRR